MTIRYDARWLFGRALCRQRPDYRHHFGIVEYVPEPPILPVATIGETGYL